MCVVIVNKQLKMSWISWTLILFGIYMLCMDAYRFGEFQKIPSHGPKNFQVNNRDFNMGPKKMFKTKRFHNLKFEKF